MFLQMCLYELFTNGEDPFTGMSMYEAIVVVLTGRTWDVLAPRLPATMPARLRDLARACCAFKAAARPRMQDVHESLKEAVAEEAAAAAAALDLI